MKTRLLGCALILLCSLLVRQLYGSVNAAPVHAADLGEMILAVLVTISGLAGAMMIVVGNELFEAPE